MKKIVFAFMAVAAGAAFGETEGMRTVFAHYMTCFGGSVESFKREIMLAQQYGIDGFALNCGNWLKKDANGKWVNHEGYVANSERMFEAARQLGTGFKLFFSADSGREHYENGFHSDMVLRFKDHPNQFRYGGKQFFSGWGGGDRRAEKYAFARKQLRELGAGEVCLVPEYGARRHVMYATKDLAYFDVYGREDFGCDGVFIFGCDNTTRELTEYLSNARFAAMKAGKICMSGPCPAYNSSNLRDYNGFAGYAAMWGGICADQPELVQVVTWNDYGEDSGLYPRSLNGAHSRTAQPRDESFLDLTAYYSAAYKAGGVYSEIEQEKIYTAQRTRPKAFTRIYAPDGDRGDETPWVNFKDLFLQIHDDVQDMVYCTAMLREPATLVGTVGGLRKEFRMGRGVHTAAMPMVLGATPEWELVRGGRSVVKAMGRRQIIERETEENSLSYGYNGIHRVWTGGAVAGEAALELAAEGGKTEWKLPEGFAGGSYNFRVAYANAGGEARYLLKVDVPWLEAADRERPATFPLYLPPTGGAVKEMSFIFTVPRGATGLRILQEELKGVKVWNRKRGGYVSGTDYSDYGKADVRGVRLIANLTAKAGKRAEPYPEMVKIPGGKFTMGAKAVEPDEGKAREVEVSAFEMGKYEVTNLEFEQFMPEHRSHRTEISWRDRDPVTYVSWEDAARYCNWLSERKGLEAAYDETNGFRRVDGANGYRLPTEAEWEYAATGRGENRTYPWGEEEPDLRRCNFAPRELTLQQEGLQMPKREIRAVPVGSCPEGASRDGVHDMAGNVAEWCSDMYHYDEWVEGKDPECRTPPRSARMNFRAIRGGSFGYYGGSQRNCDREYNNPRYPGYIYIGFRVARSCGGR